MKYVKLFEDFVKIIDSKKMSKRAFLEELKKTKKGDLIKIIRKDGALWHETIVYGTYVLSARDWEVSGNTTIGPACTDFQTRGLSNYYQDFWSMMLNDEFQIQIIKKDK
jgi:hypothetical protein